MPADLIKRVEKKLSEIHSEEVLIIGDDEEELRGMKEIIEENFPHEALTAANFDAATKILREMDFDLVIACADMKLVDGFKIMKFISSDEKFSAIPFAITTSDKLLEVVEKINQPEVEEIESLTEEIAETDAPTIEKLPVEEKASAEEKIADDSPVIHSDKKKIANVVTTLIGYELDIHIWYGGMRMIKKKILLNVLAMLFVAVIIIFSVGCGNESVDNAKVAEKSVLATKSAQKFRHNDDMFTENSRTISRGSEMFDTGNYDGAIDMFDEISALELNNVTEYNLRGKYFIRLGKYFAETVKHEKAVESFNLAIQNFDSALKIDSEDAESYINRGEAYDWIGKHETAIESYTAAIEIDSENETAYIARGEAYNILQKDDLAMEDFKKAVELNPQNFETYIARSNGYLALGQYDLALEDANKAIEVALESHKEELASYLGDSAVYAHRGFVYGRMERYDEAIANYNKALELNSKDFRAYQGLGNVYFEMERYEEAIEELSKSIEIYPTSQAVNLRRHCDYMMHKTNQEK